ncbi:phosphate-repressible phosphate permease [Microdochium trichocladiopsis]|uniref:Phosphate transporter n=1 Tax=Microdochium trichocladiopsis TaxID=1682393 RepID=A0A9P9BHK9_9PEZI|nr:phosphate-repressible phosphate permease [Microdochium trichocladiopsis]KAH7018584.1 phosphate-repressible phosphate permease [Microdochium trichocladiopsis]
MVLEAYTYVFAIGTCFALLEAYNNGANDVANAWATSVSSRSVTYRQAMILCIIFELTGALAVGARTASTIKNGIIPSNAFQGNAGVQLLAFASASAGASIWVMWCTAHSAHVSSTYSLVSSIAGVGVAAVGARNVQWGWYDGSGLGAIFAGLAMAPFISACFGAIIFLLIKYLVHVRKNPVPWAVYSSPLFFLIAGTVCTLSIVYKGSPNLGLDKKPPGWIAGVTVGTGAALCLLSAIFFVPYVHAKVVKKDYTLKPWMAIQGPLLFRRPAPADAEQSTVPNYAVIQEENVAADSDSDIAARKEKAAIINGDKTVAGSENSVNATVDQEAATPNYTQEEYRQLMNQAMERHHANLRKSRGPLGWAMRSLHRNQLRGGSIHETHNLIALFKRIPAMIVAALLYGMHYDIHTAQVGIHGSPEGRRMERVYGYATKYSNEVEHLYSFVQIITACTASFAHGANDVGNAVGVWAGMYSAWSTGNPAAAKADVPMWQLGTTAAVICIGFITYGYNIMKVMGNKLTYHSPSRGSSMEMGAAITILIFSQYKLPVSTSMCITGATVGVGLCNGHIKAVNWKRVGLLVFSWIMTIPIAGLIGGGIMALAVNTPKW